MSKESKYWKWKNTIIDFNTISDEKDEYSKYMTKKDMVFRYLGTPDEDIHEWYNGGWSSEYNTALRYARELNLVEDYIDYDDELYEKDKEIERLQRQKEELQVNGLRQETLFKLEIERLNNIINELEKWLKDEKEATIFDYHFAIEDVLNKLNELLGSDKE